MQLHSSLLQHSSRQRHKQLLQRLHMQLQQLLQQLHKRLQMFRQQRFLRRLQPVRCMLR